MRLVHEIRLYNVLYIFTYITSSKHYKSSSYSQIRWRRRCSSYQGQYIAYTGMTLNKWIINHLAYHWPHFSWSPTSWTSLTWRSMPLTTRVVVGSVRRDFMWPVCCSLDFCQDTGCGEKNPQHFDWKCCQCCQVFKIAMLNMFRLLFICFMLFLTVSHVCSTVESCLQDCFACAVCLGNGSWPFASCWPYPACCGVGSGLQKVQNMSMDSVSAINMATLGAPGERLGNHGSCLENLGENRQLKW